MQLLNDAFLRVKTNFITLQKYKDYQLNRFERFKKQFISLIIFSITIIFAFYKLNCFEIISFSFNPFI